MKAMIEIDELVYYIMMEHMMINPNLECGGYLYGYNLSTEDEINMIVNNIYYEPYFGCENHFVFRLTYGSNAGKYGRRLQENDPHMDQLGCYHSHGKYAAIFSDEDRNVLQKHWARNKITSVIVLKKKSYTENL